MEVEGTSPPTHLKAPQTAYFLFLKANRQQVREANPGLPVGKLTKLLGEQWNNLSDEEKKNYVEMAEADRLRYNAQKQEMIDAGTWQDQKSAKTLAIASNECVYPLGRVKKIIQSDDEVGRISKEATLAIGKMTELFVQYLGKKSYQTALLHKRKTIKDEDVTETIQSLSFFDWLRDDFPEKVPVITAEGSTKQFTPSKIVDLPPEKSRITSFFGNNEIGSKENVENESKLEGKPDEAIDIEMS